MDLIAVVPESPLDLVAAQDLAHSLKLPLCADADERKLYKICLCVGERLGLAFANEKTLHPFYVDFQSPEWRFRRTRGVQENGAFLKALKLSRAARFWI